MNATPITDQVGALAIVDQMRMRRMLVDELLDLPRRRKETAAAIRAYYASRRIEVTDADIDAAVGQYFQRRLTPTEEKLGWPARVMARFYVSRGTWGPRVAKSGVAVALIGLLWMGGSYAYSSHVRSTLKSEHAAELVQLAGLVDEADRQQVALREFSDAHTSYVTAAVKVKTAVVAKSVAAARSAAQLVEKTLEPKAAIEETERVVAATNAAVKRVGGLVGEAQAEVRLIRRLITADQALSDMERSDGFASLVDRHKEVADAFSLARTSLTQGNEIAIARSSDATETALRATKVDAEAQLATVAADALKDADLTLEDRDEVNGLLRKLRDEAARIDLTAVQATRLALEAKADLLKMPLRLQIVSRKGEKSAVQRTYDATGGAAWYLIVEALDETGTPVQLPIKNAETGETIVVSRFGVRVPQDVYEKVKADKVADGHVDDALLGQKASGRLHFTYRMPVLDGFITHW